MGAQRASETASMQDCVRRPLSARGMIADLVIHASHLQGDDRNSQAYVMLAMHEITAEGFGMKERDLNAMALT